MKEDYHACKDIHVVNDAALSAHRMIVLFAGPERFILT